MGLFDLFKREDINAGVKAAAADPDAVLLDVREGDEFAGGHIPGAVNVPLSLFEQLVSDAAKRTDAAVYVYCLAGSRSVRAARMLRSMGYTAVHDLGGVNAYKGQLVR